MALKYGMYHAYERDKGDNVLDQCCSLMATLAIHDDSFPRNSFVQDMASFSKSLHVKI